MLDVLEGNQCFTVTVGLKISRAQYYLEDVDAVMGMLQVRRAHVCSTHDRVGYLAANFRLATENVLSDYSSMSELMPVWVLFRCLSRGCGGAASHALKAR